jgi:tetratricopeptide (TPR) repeat protein
VAELAADARIRDLKRRLELDSTSRLFVSLAEEYRKAGRVADAVITLQQGLRNHPGYVSAQVALGRAYLDAGNISEAIATFTKVLSSDPGNLVSAKSLADIYLSRGESLEAIKKYKLYRALSGDRTVEDIIERLEKEMAPPAPRSSRASAPAPLPAPPTFIESPAGGTTRSSRGVPIPETPPVPMRPKEDVLDVTSITWDESTGGGKRDVKAASDIPTRPLPVGAPLPAALAFITSEPLTAEPAPAVTEASAPFPIEPEAPEPAAPTPVMPGEVFGPGADLPFAAGPPPAAAVTSSERPTDRLEPIAALEEEPTEAPAELAGRTLADLYFAQGHYTEALRIYDELVAANPLDAELKRQRRDAEARLLPATSTPGAADADAGLQRRLGKIRALKDWLSVVQAG